MAIFSIIIFCVALVICLICKINVVVAIIFGFFDFFIYALYKKYPIKEVLKMSVDGYLTCKNVYIVFSLISMLAALWRCCGTIPAVIYYLLSLINYKYFLVVTFLLCTAVSLVLGSLLATAATMGVICMTIARSLGLNEIMVLGAILSGVIVGDRISPMSTSCLLVANLTGTDMYDNIKRMFTTSVIPFLLTILLYFLLGTKQVVDKNMSVNVVNTLYNNYNINLFSLVPIFSIIILSLFRVNIKINVLVSMALSFFVGLINEKASVMTMLTTLITGYKSTNPEIKNIIYGGGFVSVINMLILVGVSAAFSGIIKNTDLMNVFDKSIKIVLEKTNLYASVVIFSFIYSIIGCNQSVPVILVSQTMGESIKNKKLFAIMIENSAIIIPMIIPWNLACTSCITPVNGSKMAVFYAFFVFLMLIYNFIIFFNTKDGDNSRLFIDGSNKIKNG